MGGSFDCYTSKAKTFKQVAEEFNSIAESDRHENGHMYSGGMGMKEGVENKHRTFNSVREAEDWICDNNEKWGPAYAVEAVSGEETPASTKKREKLAKISHELWQKSVRLENELNDAFAKRKSAFCGCSNCKSKINMSFARGAKCPACGESLLSTTDKKRIRKAKEKHATAQKAVNDFKPTLKKKTTAWVVGGWCSS